MGRGDEAGMIENGAGFSLYVDAGGVASLAPRTRAQALPSPLVKTRKHRAHRTLTILHLGTFLARHRQDIRLGMLFQPQPQATRIAVDTPEHSRRTPATREAGTPEAKAIVNYADDLTVLGKTPAAEMLAAVEALIKGPRLTVNAEKTRCCRVPEDSIEFLGYRIGRNYRPRTGRAYIGTRPNAASVPSICRRIRELTTRRDGFLPTEVVVERLNRLLIGWANYFTLGQVQPGLCSDR